VDGPVPVGRTPWNPLLDLHRRAQGRAGVREQAIARYGFAVPNDEALDLIVAWSPEGVVELGAGVGYLARLLADRGVDVVAYDKDPPPSATNRWFAGREPWHPVLPGDEGVVGEQTQRTLLIVWPTRDETWPADAVEAFHHAGGGRLVYVGEGPGGRSGDDRFHALLGGIPRCLACTYGVADAACTCGAPVLWRRQRTVELPQWHGYTDRAEAYTATRQPALAGPRRSRLPWRRRRL
jgi:hypothetical protein